MSTYTPSDIRSALYFALSLGVQQLRGFRQHKLSILRRVVKLTLPLNAWVLANADRAPHVVDIARHTNIVLLAAISDAMGLDRHLARDFLYGFQLTGFVESSLMHREITRPDPSEHARDCSVLQQGAWRQMLFLEKFDLLALPPVFLTVKIFSPPPKTRLVQACLMDLLLEMKC